MEMGSNSGFEESAGEGRFPIMAAGFMLLGVGLAVLWFMAGEILALYNQPGANKFILQISKTLAGARLIVDDHVVSINHELAFGAAFVIFGVMASLGLSIVSALLTAGARLLAPDVHKELAKVSVRLQELQNGMSGKFRA
ncbi:MAG: hypothetical protein OEV92_10830 [Nitrospinota bacterium]|nr:hypothetical protein [Nitrospinota bacterium]